MTRTIPHCPIHQDGDPLCYYPDTYKAAQVIAEPEPYSLPSVRQQLVDLKWEIAGLVLILTLIISYVALGS